MLNENSFYKKEPNTNLSLKQGLLKKSEMSHIKGANNEYVFEFPDLSGTQEMTNFRLTNNGIDFTN